MANQERAKYVKEVTSPKGHTFTLSSNRPLAEAAAKLFNSVPAAIRYDARIRAAREQAEGDGQETDEPDR